MRRFTAIISCSGLFCCDEGLRRLAGLFRCTGEGGCPDERADLATPFTSLQGEEKILSLRSRLWKWKNHIIQLVTIKDGPQATIWAIYCKWQVVFRTACRVNRCPVWSLDGRVDTLMVNPLH